MLFFLLVNLHYLLHILVILNLDLFLLHWTVDGFHKSNGKERRIVFAPGLLSYEQISNAGKKVGYELQATSKSGENKTLDAKQLVDTVPKEKEDLKQLLATVPKTKEELFSHDINWAIYEEVKQHYPPSPFSVQYLKKKCFVYVEPDNSLSLWTMHV